MEHEENEKMVRLIMREYRSYLVLSQKRGYTKLRLAETAYEWKALAEKYAAETGVKIDQESWIYL